MMMRFFAIVTAVMVSACSGNNSTAPSPTPAPAPTTATLHMAVDFSTCFLLGQVAISVDGSMIGTVTPGGAGVSDQVSIGTHYVSGVGVTRDGLHATQWSPQAVPVPAGGENV